MINMKAAGATQLTESGVLSDWIVTLNEEEMYTLPPQLSAQETIDIRRIVEKYMKYAYNEGMKDMEDRKNIEIEQLLIVGNAQLDALILDRDELSLALERHMISNQENY